MGRSTMNQINGPSGRSTQSAAMSDMQRKWLTAFSLFILVPYLVTSSPAPDAKGADIQTQVSAHVVVPGIPASIRTPELERPRFIITARALDTESEAEEEVHETDSEAESTEYSTETEEMVASSEDQVSSTAPSVGTTPTTPAAEEGREAGDDSGADEHAAMAVDEDDLKVEPSNVQIQVENRSRADHEVIYARLKQPIRPLNEQTESPIGSLFGRPYSRPFGPRQPTTAPTPTIAPSEKGLIPVPFRPSSANPTVAPVSADFETTGSWVKPNRWDKEKASNQRINMTRVQHLEAECQNDFMKIRIRFNGSFSGIIYSTGFAYDPLCVYINGTGRDYYEFYIQLNRCGTLGGNTHNLDSRKQPTKNFMWNTLSIQYSALIEEEWDEHYKVTCEYGYDYWKTVTFPFLDVEVATGNPLTFTLTPPECHMEIRQGYGSTGTRVTGPVRVGDPLTLIVYMRSQFDGFDLIVSDCYAHNGASKKIQLIDNNGCPVNEKLISRFRGTWTDAGLYETQVFAYMKAFRFTGSPALYIECDVRMCHGHCPNQPCYWRTGKQLTKRHATEAVTSAKATANTTLSENISLFQALQVVADDTELSSQPDSSVDSSKPAQPSDEICLKPSALGAAIGLAGLLYVLLGLMSCIMCIRLRRSQRCQSQSDLYHPQSFTSTNHSKHRQF